MAKRRKGMDSSAAELLRYTYLALFLTHMLHKADCKWFKEKCASFCFITVAYQVGRKLKNNLRRFQKSL